jgi:hypothetical protein
MTLPTGSKLMIVQYTRPEFIKVFSDVIKDETTATDYDFKLFDPRFQECVDLSEDRELSDRDKLRVEVSRIYDITIYFCLHMTSYDPPTALAGRCRLANKGAKFWREKKQVYKQ